MMLIKKLIKRIIRGYKCDTDHYINYLKQHGAKIGQGIVMFSPETLTCDIHNCHLLRIGDNVQITEHVTLLMHDYSWSVIKGVTGEIVGNQNNLWIGNNVFIGVRSTILPGTTIGNNVIIGAGSVVKGDVAANSVYAGVPAKRIMSIEEYREKRLLKQKDEAVNVAIQYFLAHKQWPPIEVFHEYFFIFSKATNNTVFLKKLELVGNYNQSLEALISHKPLFESYESFLDYAKSVYASQEKVQK